MNKIQAVTKQISYIESLTSVFKNAKEIYDKFIYNKSYYISISSEDPSYVYIQRWLEEKIHKKNQKGVELISLYEDSKYAGLRTAYDSIRDQSFYIGSYLIKVRIESPEIKEQITSRNIVKKLVFVCPNLLAKDKLLQELADITALYNKQKSRPKLHVISQWGDWQYAIDVPDRSIESVVLAAGQMESITESLSNFLKQEKEYIRRGLPWHKGFLFEGPAGTGKTSIAIALANFFNLDLWIANLGDIEKDNKLLSLFSQIAPRSILLLEDIEVYQNIVSRNSEEGRSSLAGLLNALDGVSTPHGLITIMTSNKPGVLDSALIRPGRIDTIEKIDYITTEQSYRLFKQFYNEESNKKWNIPSGTTCAELMEIFKQNMFDPNAAQVALVNNSFINCTKGHDDKRF